jgi:hypothetical protein
LCLNPPSTLEQWFSFSILFNDAVSIDIVEHRMMDELQKSWQEAAVV